MSVSTNKIFCIVASLFDALFNVTVHAYCAVCAWSVFSVVTQTALSGNITAQYKIFELPASHRMVLLIVC